MVRKLGMSAGIALLVTMLITSVAGALITAATGEVHRAPPPSSVVLNQHEHLDSGPQPSGAHAFDEEQDYTTMAPIALDVCTANTSAFLVCPSPKSGNIDRPSSLSPGTIPAGTCIDSHFVHADPPGATGPVRVYGGLSGSQRAEVRFDSPILGVVLLSTSLVASDADPGLGPTPVTYGAEPQRGLELNAGGSLDGIRIELTQNRVEFVFNAGAADLDQIRVITLGDADSCPGQAVSVILSPKVASNRVDTQHCVVATAKTETGGPAEGVTIHFDVEGASELDTQPADEDASKTTDENGTAEHCYRGPNLVGADTIHAYADNDGDGVQDIGTDPSDDATKTWLPADAHTVVLDPKADENPVGSRHCVTATVRDAFGNPVPNETVRFSVTGTVQRSGSDTTDDLGVAEFCYSSQVAGLDVIEAFVDQDGDKTHDPTEPSDMATKVWQPGDPATLLLEPKVAENEVTTQHCVIATVRDAFTNPVPNVVVLFDVIGVNMTDGAEETDGGGQATFCYVGGTLAGPDAITAFADTDDDAMQDATEPGDAATKTWLPLEPAILTLTPKTAENPVTDRPEDGHCVQAHVTDIFLNPNPDILVRFTVTGTVELERTDRTDNGGIAEMCYTSTTAGLDMIHAYADTDEDNVQDPEEPFDDATKLWQPGDPAMVTLTPETSVNEVETEHCVKAEVRDAFGNATPDRLVRFDVEGASEQDAQPADEDGSDRTDEFGNATFCYTGPDLPGADTIHAYADNDEDNVEDPGEPFDDATKTWILPPSTPGCEITIHTGGWILTTLGDKGSFGGNARIELDGTITRGELEYHDHSALLPINLHSIEVLVIVCEALDGDGDGTPDGQRASVYGTGKVNGIGPVDFRVRVSDRGEPGSAPGPDTYQIITAAYASGPEENPLQGGNIQIRRFD